VASKPSDFRKVIPGRKVFLRRDAILGFVGFALALILWWSAVALLASADGLAAQFSPVRALQSLPALVTEDRLWLHARASLTRVLIGLLWATLIGVPLGFMLGRVPLLNAALAPTLQFLRMVSPLSWMPIAVMGLGIGERPVDFLLTFAAVWPLIMNTASGVTQVDRRWIELGDSLAATHRELLWHIYAPAIAAHVLTGIRLAIGILWIVLVPAEMLGVSSGLGYLILDTRDRLAYSELAAVVLVIGALGFLLDAAARLAYRQLGSDSRRPGEQ
jgi:NitT/TauT family transport system permease protein